MNENQEITAEQFSDMVDRFVSLANELGNDMPRPRVNAAILFAAARYNAFNWAFRHTALEQTVDEAALMFRSEYETMFRNNANEMVGVRAKADATKG